MINDSNNINIKVFRNKSWLLRVITYVLHCSSGESILQILEGKMNRKAAQGQDGESREKDRANSVSTHFWSSEQWRSQDLMIVIPGVSMSMLMKLKLVLSVSAYLTPVFLFHSCLYTYNFSIIFRLEVLGPCYTVLLKTALSDGFGTSSLLS